MKIVEQIINRLSNSSTIPKPDLTYENMVRWLSVNIYIFLYP